MEYLDFLYGEEQGYICLVTKGIETGQPDRQRFFEVPAQLEFAQTYINMRQDVDVWNGVNVFTEKTRTASDAEAKSNVVYADADYCHPDNFRIKPSLSVETSPNRWHCYWKLDKAVNADVASHLSHKIAVAHKDEGCDQSGWIKTKLLRVPGTTNTKHGADIVTPHYTGEIYTVAEIEKAYADVDVSTVVVHNTDEFPAFLPIAELEERLMVYPTIAQIYASVVQKNQSWGDRTFRLATDLFRVGTFTDQEVFTLVWNSPACKFVPSDEQRFTETGVPIPHQRPNPEADTWRHVLSAKEVAAEPYEVTVTPDVEPDLIEQAVGTFLTDNERQYVKDNPTFIQEFVDWVETRSPISSRRLRRTAAYSVLSCLFADLGYFDGYFGKVYPNLWILKLGETSTTKKTTIWNLANEIIQAGTTDIGDDINIGNDFTPESLNTVLGERDGKVSLFERDEIQGFFVETMNKQYLAGVKDFLTDLYNGTVRKSLRQNKAAGQAKSNIKTVFNIYGMGTETNVTAVLKQEDFSSGFMMRWLYAVAEERSFSFEDRRLRTRQRDDIAPTGYVDPKPKEFVERFFANMSKLKQKNPSGFITFGKEADERLAAWQYHMFDMADRFPDNKNILPAVDRLNINIHKCCILIAMSQGRFEVSLGDVLEVLVQAEMWYEDMTKVISLVSESAFQQECNEVERYITTGNKGRRNRANILRRFAGYRTRQVEEYLEALVQQGRISLSKEGVSIFYSVIR